MGAVAVNAHFVTVVGLGAVARVEGNDGEILAVPFLGIGPVNLHVGVAERVDVALDVRRTGFGAVFVGQVIGEELAQRHRVAARLGGAGLRAVAHARTRRFEEVREAVLLVVAVAGRGAHGVVYFVEVLAFERQVGEDLGHVRQGKESLVGIGVERSHFVAGGECEGAEQRRGESDRFHFANSLDCCKVTNN